MSAKQIIFPLLIAIGLASCEGGSVRKKNCKFCETITSGQGQQTSQIERRVCGEKEVTDYITANTVSTSSLSVVTTCK